MILHNEREFTNYVPNITSQELFGLFELDTVGTVLYSRVRENNQLLNSKPDWVGQNYFEEVAPFENINEFRRRFTNFVKGRHSAESFTFDCRFQETIIPVKVLMSGAYEVSSSEPANIVILDIRKSQIEDV